MEGEGYPMEGNPPPMLPEIHQLERRGSLPEAKPPTRIPPMCTLTLLREEGPALRSHPRIWDPACGRGDISDILRQAGLDVIATDGGQTTYGSPGIPFQAYFDLLASAIVCYPPPRQAGEFATHAVVDLRAPYVALLGNALMLSGEKKFALIYEHTPPQRVYVYASPIRLRPQTRNHTTAIWNPLVWAIWDRSLPWGQTSLRWIGDRPLV